MIPLIADTTTQAAPDSLISGAWLIQIVQVAIAAIGTAGAAWIVALRKGRVEGARDERSKSVTLQEPVPEVPVKRTYTPPTFYQHQELVRRVTALETDAKEHREYVETQLRDIRREGAEQFVKLMEAGETRKDTIMENMNAMMRSFHARVDQILDTRTPQKKLPS